MDGRLLLEPVQSIFFCGILVHLSEQPVFGRLLEGYTVLAGPQLTGKTFTS
jgi:hypothetical protein